MIAPTHGTPLVILVENGDSMHKGQRLAVIEAMKMEHALTAPLDRVIADIAVAAGSRVATQTAMQAFELFGGAER